MMNTLRTTKELIKRLRKHPVITMDKQNVTNDAADKIEEQQKQISELKKKRSKGEINVAYASTINRQSSEIIKYKNTINDLRQKNISLRNIANNKDKG